MILFLSRLVEMREYFVLIRKRGQKATGMKKRTENALRRLRVVGVGNYFWREK
jgi:hypothetical protein